MPSGGRQDRGSVNGLSAVVRTAGEQRNVPHWRLSSLPARIAVSRLSAKLNQRNSPRAHIWTCSGGSPLAIA